jgi:hypothetical protein
MIAPGPVRHLRDPQVQYRAAWRCAVGSRHCESPRRASRCSWEDADFFVKHHSYDRNYTATHLVLWLTTALHGHGREERTAFVRACAQREHPMGVPPRAAAILTRHAPVAAVMTDFYRKFQLESRQARYPLEALRRVGASDNSFIARLICVSADRTTELIVWAAPDRAAGDAQLGGLAASRACSGRPGGVACHQHGAGCCHEEVMSGGSGLGAATRGGGNPLAGNVYRILS